MTVGMDNREASTRGAESSECGAQHELSRLGGKCTPCRGTADGKPQEGTAFQKAGRVSQNLLSALVSRTPLC